MEETTHNAPDTVSRALAIIKSEIVRLMKPKNFMISVTQTFSSSEPVEKEYTFKIFTEYKGKRVNELFKYDLEFIQDLRFDKSLQTVFKLDIREKIKEIRKQNG